MTLWFVFALMTVAAIFAVLWPLRRGVRTPDDGSEAVVYRDQLAEIDRDVAAGLIGASEAEAARVEISRRLLAAADGEARTCRRIEHSVAPFGGRDLALVGLPIVAVAVLSRRSDRRSSAIFRSRSARARPMPTSRSTTWWRRSRRISRKIRPTAAAGPCWRRCWRSSAATTTPSGPTAIRITYAGDSAERRSDLGEALAVAAGGVVTAEAKAEFERAVALNADEAKASYFLGLAAEQDGRDAEAASIWRAMLAKAPPDAPWRPLIAGGAGAGRRSRRAVAVERGRRRGQGHEREPTAAP